MFVSMNNYFQCAKAVYLDYSYEWIKPDVDNKICHVLHIENHIEIDIVPVRDFTVFSYLHFEPLSNLRSQINTSFDFINVRKQ